MIHLYNDCNCVKTVGFNDICLDCSTRSANDFKSAVVNKKEPLTFPESYRQVWRQLVHGGATWRVIRKHNPLCGHPGVKDTQGKCVICKMERQASESSKTPIEQYVINLRQSVTELREKADKAEALLAAISFGFIPEEVNTKSPRQFAIEQGEKWYAHDEPCRHCGKLSERYVANGRCRNCGK